LRRPRRFAEAALAAPAASVRDHDDFALAATTTILRWRQPRRFCAGGNHDEEEL
jgi:hypothetical protein